MPKLDLAPARAQTFNELVVFTHFARVAYNMVIHTLDTAGDQALLTDFEIEMVITGVNTDTPPMKIAADIQVRRSRANTA